MSEEPTSERLTRFEITSDGFAHETEIKVDGVVVNNISALTYAIDTSGVGVVTLEVQAAEVRINGKAEIETVTFGSLDVTSTPMETEVSYPEPGVMRVRARGTATMPRERRVDVDISSHGVPRTWTQPLFVGCRWCAEWPDGRMHTGWTLTRRGGLKVARLASRN